MLAVSATAVPEIPENSMEPVTLASPSPPRICPTSALEKRVIWSVMPPAFIRLPASTKPGIHSNTNTSMPAYIFCGITTSGNPAARI